MAPRAEGRVLDLDEVADVHVGAELGAGAQPRERADERARADARAERLAVDVGVGPDRRAGADARVADARSRRRCARRRRARRAPSKMQPTSISTSLPQRSSPRRSKRAGSARRTPASISAFGARALEAPLEVGELRRAVDAEHLGLAARRATPTTGDAVGDRHARRRRSGSTRRRRCRCVSAASQRFSAARRRRHHAGVDLADRALRRRSRPSPRRSPRDAAAAVAHDAAVAASGRPASTVSRASCVAAARRRPARCSGVGLDQRHVAVEDQGRAVVVEQRRRLLQRRGRCRAAAPGARTRARARRVACSTSSAPWPVTTIVRVAPRPAAASRTCCNKCRPARRCSTFGRADLIRVPLPAAMITMFNTMPPTCLPVPSIRRRLSRDARGLGAVLGLRAAARQARLQPGPRRSPSAGSTAMSTSTTRSRCACAPALDDVVRLASAHAAARLRRPAGAGRRPSCRATPRAERDVRLGRRAARPASTPRSSSAVPAMAEIVPTLSPAQLASIEKRYAKTNDEYRDDFLQRDPAKRAARPRSSARSSAPRCSTAASTTRSASFVARSVAASPFDADVAYAERQRAPAGPAGDRAPPARRTRQPRRRAAPRSRAYVQRHRRARRARAYRRYQERLVDAQLRYAAASCTTAPRAEQRQQGGEEAQGLRGRPARPRRRRRHPEASAPERPGVADAPPSRWSCRP